MRKMIRRELANQIKKDFFKGKVSIIVGPRQVGKTTLVKSLLAGQKQVVRFLGDNPTDKSQLENKDLEQLIQQYARHHRVYKVCRDLR